MPSTQAAYRRDMTAKDELGRPWSLSIELKTGDPTGQILPAGWIDTMATPMKYLRVPKDEYGQPVWGRIELDLAQWRRDIEVAEREWRKQLWRCGEKAYVNKFNPKTAENDEYLMTLAGPRPKPTVAELDALIAQTARVAESNEKAVVAA